MKTMQVTCSHCGASNPDSYRFCVVCGARLGGSPPPQARISPPPAVASAPTAPLSGIGTPPSFSPAPTLLGGRYLVDCVLGRGGMSTVYRAHDTRLSNRVVAVKEMVDQFASPEERAEAERDFQREADLLAALHHVAIPAVFDRFSQNSRHYLVMECIEGENLEAALAQRTEPYSEEQARAWALELCALLRYLHEQRPPVIFRDLKPGNILVDPAGRLRLIDFGIARFFRPSQATDTTALGTSGYASPEHYTGQTDARSDLYSLGATLHHLLTLRDPSKQPPFQFPAMRSINLAVSPELEEIVNRLLSSDRMARFASAAEVEAALRARPRPAVRSRPAPVSQANAPALAAGTSPALPRTMVAPGTLVLVITRIRRMDTSLLANEVAPLLGQPQQRAAELLRHLPLVAPLTPTPQMGNRLKRLRDMGTDARGVMPATESVRLSPALQRALLTNHQIEIWDTTVGPARSCRCWRCGHRWLTRNPVGSAVPERCPNCRSQDWSRRRLCKCAWCGHEFEVRAEQQSPDIKHPFCECCGLRGWLHGRRDGWQGLVQTFRDLLGLQG
ncbi:MAG TPA: protein kinase [Chloroflexota bacterium]|nr:protein kinase [Chloroflexota bacterium]